ncbi:MAG: single-stranded-DNA-specific exonuclease RecJ [Ruminococcus sp.]|nr:single-stranded-DNA-specific exonuclease RecJ [Ruminococcus sp.]
MKLWKVAPLDKNEANAIQNQYHLPGIIAMLLQIRGITTAQEIEDFLHNDTEIEPPWDIKDMEKACVRVHEAIAQEELICVYGDYDADGVTSTALLYSYLEAVGAHVMYYIPSREAEGYGMNNAAVDTLHQKGVKLIVTVDNGIAAINEIRYAKSLGVDTVVTDHHMPLGELPDACAVVDLHRSDCPSRFKQLSGVGVAFKLIMALEGEYCDVDSLLDMYADLLCLGTIGDIVELKSENRVFVKRGLLSMRHTERTGLYALIRNAGLMGKPITAGNVSFTLVPRINAVGRLGASGRSVELLLTNDEEEAGEFAAAMSYDNAERQQIERDILEKIDARVTRDPRLVMDKVLVLDGENWHQGVVGIVASRIREIYGKPTIIISRDGENAKASGRSVEGFALCDAVAACGDLLTHYGGHPMAAGLSLPSANIDVFRKRINDYADRQSTMPFDTLHIDCKLNPAAISLDLVGELNVMKPYGAGNPTPVFGFFNMVLTNIIPLSNNKHLRLVLSRGSVSMSAMLFFTSTEDFPYEKGEVLDIAATLEINEYNDRSSVSVIIKDVKAHDEDAGQILSSGRIFETFCRGGRLRREELQSILPDREDFALLYRYLRDRGGYNRRTETLVGRLQNRLSYGKIRVALEAMNELGLIQIQEGLKTNRITLRRVSRKVDLSSASIIKKLREVTQ